MNLRTMYPPQKDSPSTFIQGDISATDIYIVVGNSDMLPQEVPYPLTLGIDKTLTETVIVTEIGQGNNQLTVTRQQGSLAWLAGTKVARVFNAADLLTLQQNVTDVVNQSNTNQENIITHDDAITALEETVGDESSGLVKGLADEINRATAAETAEETRATAAESALDAAKPNRTELPQVITDWKSSADGTEMLITLTRYNANTKTTSTYTRVIPLVSDSSVGLMTPEAYEEVSSLRNDVNALQGSRDVLKERVETIETDLSVNKVIELMQSLRTSQSLIESLEDSSMEEILDSDGNPLKAQIRLQII